MTIDTSKADIIIVSFRQILVNNSAGAHGGPRSFP